MQYEAKVYLVDKNILKREKMKIKAHINFLMNYDSTNIYLIWTFNQRKIFKICDVIFDENNYYQSYEINAAQLISELFLKNDTLNISKNNLKFIEIKFNNDEKLFKLISIEIIIVDLSKTKESINKNDKNYLSSSTLFSLKEENISQTTSSESRSQLFSEHLQQVKAVFTFFSQAVFTRFHYFRTLLDEKNILSKNLIYFQKFNLSRQAYYIALNRKKAYYESFVTSMKKKRNFIETNFHQS